jgi:hypothetical protein
VGLADARASHAKNSPLSNNSDLFHAAEASIVVGLWLSILYSYCTKGVEATAVPIVSPLVFLLVAKTG